MKTGMLWMDKEPDGALEVKIRRAVRYYQQRFGQLPNLCFVHPSLLLGQAEGDIFEDALGIEVLGSQHLEPEQLWVGFKDALREAEPVG